MSRPQDFIYLDQIDASIIIDMRYYSAENFVGRRIQGYESPRCLLTLAAAQAICKVQQQLQRDSLGLKIFDGYRPQQAVNDFIAWSEDASDQKMKQDYYPNINKADLFALHYLAKKSSHSRGSTVDLTIVRLSQDGKEIAELVMGTPFDFLDELSHPLSQQVSQKSYTNRMYLRELMHDAGFRSIETEWWHFTLVNEPYPDTYFDFVVA